MDSFRSSLEVLKFLPPQEVLTQLSQVSKVWSRASNSDELWITFFDSEQVPALQSCSSFKAGYQHFRCSPFSLFLLSKQSIDVFNVRKKRWVRRVRIQRRLPTDTASAFVVLPDGSLLICGGGDPVLAAAFRVDLNGVVVDLGPMEQARAEHGIVQMGSCVYVFGGENDFGMLKSYERIEWEYLASIQACRWQALGNMHSARKLLKPCVYEGLIYLYGGFTPDFEVYNPATNQFAMMSQSVNDFNCETLAVVEGSYLHMFTSHSHLSFHPTYKEFSCTSCKQLATVWGKRNGILYHHSVYFTFDNLVHKFDLRKSKLYKVSY